MIENEHCMRLHPLQSPLRHAGLLAQYSSNGVGPTPEFAWEIRVPKTMHLNSSGVFLQPISGSGATPFLSATNINLDAAFLRRTSRQLTALVDAVRLNRRKV
jgi:hypothetical protein